MPYADNQGVRIHYQVEGTGLPLVLQHWSLATLESWYDYGYVSGLKNEYQLILLDGRGHGASDKPREPEAYALEHRVADILAVLDDMDIAKAHYYGYSMGGWIGFGIALHAPERFQSLIIGGAQPYADSLESLRQLIRIGVVDGPGAFVEMWENEVEPLSPEHRRRMLAFDYEILLTLAQDREGLEAVLPAMRMPCLLYVGEKDEIFTAVQACAQQMPNVRLATFAGLDHGDVIKRSDLVLPQVKRFLAMVTNLD